MNNEYHNTYLLLNGTPPKDCTELNNADYIVCADGAYNWAKHSCIPNIVIGDQDSVINLPKELPNIKFPKDKDLTDGMLALQHLLSINPSKITIMGARGGRADMDYYNYFLLYFSNPNTQIIMDAGDFWVELIRDNFVGRTSINNYVSLSPFMGSVHIQYTKGLKYEIRDVVYNIEGIAPISNIALQENFEIQVNSGMCLVFYQK